MDERQVLAAMRVSGREALLRQCLTNVQAILEEAGSSLAKAVSFTVVFADGDDFAGMNENGSDGFLANPWQGVLRVKTAAPTTNWHRNCLSSRSIFWSSSE
jgi:enamine deaminase RidA (YjgF/YER057c/UK114 family)